MFKKKKLLLKVAPRSLVTRDNAQSIVSEQYRTIRTNINFSMPDEELKTILVTSANSGEGKSTSAANIAVVFAQEGKKVLLVDGDMRRPTMHYTFRTTNRSGLSNLLTRQWNSDDVVIKTGVEGLDLITCGQIPPNPAELLGSKSMDILIKELKLNYDIIIFDAPPVLSVADAQILTNKCDGTILVINSGVTDKESAKKAKEVLQTSKANIIGTLLNNFKIEKNHYYSQNYFTS